MIFQLFTHIILVSTMLQVLPVDALDLERRAISAAEVHAVSSYSALTLPKARLPAASNTETAPVKRDPNRLGVVTTARSAVVIDRATGVVLFQKNINEPRSIGSITKLMTAYVFLKSDPDLNRVVTLAREDVRFGGVQHLLLSDTYKIEDLLLASLVSSDNTATAALVRLSGLSQGDFVAKMNEEAASIGMTQTTFADSTGLSSKNQSVVSDVAILLDKVGHDALLSKATQTAALSITGGSGRVYSMTSTNELLSSFINRSPYKINAAKTGFLPEAGYCLGSLFSFKGDHEIIVVVLGSDSKEGRFMDVKALAEWTYDVYQWN